jgi:hypothetical protein
VQELLGHADASTTMIDTHALKVGGMGVRNPLDAMARPATVSALPPSDFSPTVSGPVGHAPPWIPRAPVPFRLTSSETAASSSARRP